MLKADTLTILAEGSRAVLLGTEEGSVIPCTRLLFDILYRDHVKQPIRHTLPPEGSPEYLGYKMQVKTDVPATVILIFQHLRAHGLHVYLAFEPGRNLWHLRELRLKPGYYCEEIDE